MTNGTVTVRYTLTPSLLFRAQMAMLLNISWLRRGGIVVLVLLPMLWVWVQWISGEATLHTTIVNNLPWIIGFPVFWLVGIPLLQRRQAARTLRSTPAHARERTFSFAPDGISITTGVSNGHLEWEGVARVAETRHFVLLYLNKAAAHIIPKAALSNPAELAQLRTLVSEAIGNRAHWLASVDVHRAAT